MATKEKIILTQAALDSLQKEYRNLIDVERQDVIEKLQMARSQGDLSENADYDAARDRQAQIEARIQELEAIFNNYVLFTPASGDRIAIGDVVTYVDESTKEEVTVAIGGSVGSNPFAETPLISNESPLGQALLGQNKGSRVTVVANEVYSILISKVVRDGKEL